MQENSKKCLLRTENKSFFLSVYACIGCFGVLKGEIKKLDIYKHWCEVPRVYTVLFVTHDNN